MTLIETIFIQGIFACKTMPDIIKLIFLQPDPSLFFKSFIELDNANMVSLLSFDSRCVNRLLSDLDKIECKNPVFYKICHSHPNTDDCVG